MKFYNYLNEESFEKKIEKLKIECAPFLKTIKNSSNLIYSGRNLSDPIIRKKIRKNRVPRDMPLEIHKMFDNEFKKKMGIKVRSNGVFITKSEYTAESYGDLYYVFPSGKNYKIIYSPKVEDLYDVIENKVRKYVKTNHIELYSYIEYDFSRFSNIDLKKVPDLKNFIEKEVKDLISTYKITNKILPSIEIEIEMVLICDYIWLLDFESMPLSDILEMAKSI